MPDPVDALLALPRFGSGLGLHRVLALLDQLDPRWPSARSAIKITGSNGKGSTSTMVAAILGALGLRVGLLVSPHLRRIHERILVEDQPIAEADLQASATWVLQRIDAYRQHHPEDRFGAFEALTLAGLHHLAGVDLDVVVAEAGIGGRYDPTRVIPGRTCGLVSVAREHTALLGDTEEAIAFDKADLCPASGDLVVGPLPTGLLDRLQAYCRLRDVRLHQAAVDLRPTVHRAEPEGSAFSLTGASQSFADLWLPLAGAHMIDNAGVAVRLVQRWLDRHRPDLRPRLPTATREALRSLRLRGRLERVHEDPPVVVDIGHNRPALERVAQALTHAGSTPVVLITGVSADRDPQIVAPLVPIAARVLCTRAHHRGGPPTRLESAVRQLAPKTPCECIDSIQPAMERALGLARAEGMTVLVAGGLFLAMEAVSVLEGQDPRAIRFL